MARKPVHNTLRDFEKMAEDFGFNARLMWESRVDNIGFPFIGLYQLGRKVGDDYHWNLAMVQGGTKEGEYTIYACQPMASYEEALIWASEVPVNHSRSKRDQK